MAEAGTLAKQGLKACQ